VPVPRGTHARLGFSLAWDTLPQVLKGRVTPPEVRAFVARGGPVEYDYTDRVLVRGDAIEIQSSVIGDTRTLDLPTGCQDADYYVSITSWPGIGPTILKNVALEYSDGQPCVSTDGGNDVEQLDSGNGGVVPSGCSCSSGTVSPVLLAGLLAALSLRRRALCARR
jgi:uncharacterized protein (TIGR03382 family)